MIEERLPIESVGTRLVTPVRLGEGRVAKGTLIDATLADRLHASGVERIRVERPLPGELDENAAAARVADVLAGANVRCIDTRTGRVNLAATVDGWVRIDAGALVEANLVDEGVAISTRRDGARVRSGERIATVKIVPWSVPGETVRAVQEALAGDVLSVVTVRAPRIAVLTALTDDARDRDRVLADRYALSLRARVETHGGTVIALRRASHRVEALSDALDVLVRHERVDLVLLGGPRSVTGREDIASRAIVRTDGTVVRHGMPVEPGNLMLFGRIDDAWVLGLPGCARSPVDNGLDLVLERLLAGRQPDARWLAELGVGGLLQP